MYAVVLALGILALLGFAVGVRPQAHNRPVRRLAPLAAFSVIVLLAMWAVVSEGGIRWLRASGVDDLEMIGVQLVLSLVFVAGIFVLLPAWGYVIGRTVSRRRIKGRPKAHSKASLEGW